MLVNCNTVRRARAEHGFTLIEVTIILLVLVILSTIILPQLGNYNRLSRFVKVTEDLVVYCSGMKKMLDEVMGNAFWEDPRDREWGIGLLFTDGRVPRLSPMVEGMDPTAVNWLIPDVGGELDPIYTDSPDQVEGFFAADHFMNHFQMNNPLGDYDFQHYLSVREVTQEWFAFGWHGPYFNNLLPDPWGQRYAANVFALHAVDGNIYTSAVVVLSAGPYGIIDTKFDMYYKTILKWGDRGPGYELGTDDQACVLSAGGPF